MAPTVRFSAISVTIGILAARVAPQYLLRASLPFTIFTLFALQWLSYAAWSIFIWPLFISPLRHLPQPKDGNSLIFGQFPRIYKDPTGVPQREWANTIPNDGLIYYRSLLNAERLVITSPKALTEVMTTKPYEFPKPSMISDGVGRILGIGILFAEGDEHKRQRRLLNPAFAFRHIKDLYPVFWAKAAEMTFAIRDVISKPSLSSSKPSNEINVADFSSRATLDIIGVAGLSQDFHAIENPDHNELYRIYQTLFSAPTDLEKKLQFLGLIFPNWFLRRLPFKRNTDITQGSGRIRSVCRQLVTDKKQLIAKAKEDKEDAGKDILAVALKSGGFSDEDLVNQLMTFLAAGHETTATSTLWAVYELAKRPEMQERLQNDLKAAGIPNPLLSSSEKETPSMTEKEIESVPYLHAITNEVLRYHPPVALTMRVSKNSNSTIMGQRVPKGTTILLVPEATNFSHELWGEDAREFRPERWLSTNPETGKVSFNNNGGVKSPYGFLTFLHGSRSCIGQGFARAEFACLVAAWASSFSTELVDPNYDPELVAGIVSRPKHGVPVKIKLLDD